MYDHCGHLFPGKEFLFYYFSSTLSLRMNGFLIRQCSHALGKCVWNRDSLESQIKMPAELSTFFPILSWLNENLCRSPCREILR